MIPFLDEFHSNTASHTKITNLSEGEHAIILSLHFIRALVVKITKNEGNWIHGLVVAPLAYAIVGPAQDTFSRDGNAMALHVPADQLEALLSKYPAMNEPK